MDFWQRTKPDTEAGNKRSDECDHRTHSPDLIRCAFFLIPGIKRSIFIFEMIGAKRTRTPAVLQLEAVECGAAALAIILAHHGRHIPLTELRKDCGVSRHGSKAANVVKAARRHGMIARGFSKEIDALKKLIKLEYSGGMGESAPKAVAPKAPAKQAKKASST